MLFNSIEFAIFLPSIFLLYWLVFNKSLKLQNILLLFASCYFYSVWDYRFLFLLLTSTLFDFVLGQKIYNSQNVSLKKFFFYGSILINLSVLFFFKYYNFFIDSFVDAFLEFGIHLNVSSLNLILPIGISFYTFHELSYIIDIYKDRIKPEKNFVNYALFVTFFPLLVAGPIERATHLLPQIKVKRNFDYQKAIDGLRQILWGLFKKIVIADTCAGYVDMVFNNSDSYSGMSHIFAAILFAFQIYCDFSGYSDIALGSARLFGIELLQNFSFPYFSRDIAEFWRRWHISLSSWFRDYLYIPLGGSKGGKLLTLRNTIIIFIVSGFWHGANWTFIIWGGLHALYFIPLLVFKRNRRNLNIVAQNRKLPTFSEFIAIFTTFCLTTFAWIFFRAKDLNHAIEYIINIFKESSSQLQHLSINVISVLIFGFMIIEWIGRENKYAINKFLTGKSIIIRWGFYAILILMIFNFSGVKQQFIYFQF